jgi:hypothetical protein
VTEVSKIELVYSAKGVEAAVRQDERVRASVKKTGSQAQGESGKIERWLNLHTRSLLLVSGALVGAFGVLAAASPSANAHLSGIRLAFGLLADSIMLELEPAFIELTDFLLDAEEGFSNLPRPVRGAIAALIVFGFVLGTVGVAIVAFAKIAGALAALNSFPAVAVAAGRATLFFAGVLGFLTGVLAVVALDQAGVLPWLDELDKKFGTKLPRSVQDFILVLTAVPATLGSVVVALARGDDATEASKNHVEKLRDAWMGLARGVADAIKSAVDDMKVQLVKFATWIAVFFKNLADKALGWGRDIIENIGKGIGNAKDKVQGGLNSAGNWIKDKLGFDVPRNDRMAMRWGMDAAKFFTAGLADGLTKSRLDPFASSPVMTPQSTTSSVTHSSSVSVVIENGAIQLHGAEAANLDERRLVDRIVKEIGGRFGGRASA